MRKIYLAASKEDHREGCKLGILINETEQVLSNPPNVEVHRAGEAKS